MSTPCIQSSSTSRNQAITDIIESIALEECAISHILNAEGEKLQRVAAFPHLCTDEIVIVNSSICDILKHITELEHELQGKLGLFTDCFCKCTDGECDCCGGGCACSASRDA